jgi:GMP synthase-like glutamine amidotransferase
MTICVLQHEDAVGAGLTLDWARERGHGIIVTRFDRGEKPPAAFDWLVVAGGTMNVDDEVAFPWLTEEKKFLGEAIAAGKIVVGLCLGAQLIARSLGAPVGKNPHREVGWHAVESVSTQHPLGGVLPRQARVFQWHEDTFALPAGATLLAQSVACEHQIFVWGDRVIGLQGHLEATPEWVQAILDAHGEPRRGPFVQSVPEMLPNPADFANGRTLFYRLFDALAERTRA